MLGSGEEVKVWFLVAECCRIYFFGFTLQLRSFFYF